MANAYHFKKISSLLKTFLSGIVMRSVCLAPLFIII